MSKKITENFSNVTLEKVSNEEFWLHFEFLESRLIVNEPIEIDSSLRTSDGTFVSDLCEFLFILKHIHWQIPRSELESLMIDPTKTIVEEYSKYKKY